MLTTVITSIAAYIGTALDDLFILTLLFSQADDLAHRKHVLQGQCLGIAALAALSLLAAAGLQLLPPWAVGLMGLIPLGLGVREWFRSAKADEETEDETVRCNPCGFRCLLRSNPLCEVLDGRPFDLDKFPYRFDICKVRCNSHRKWICYCRCKSKACRHHTYTQACEYIKPKT